MRQSRSIIALIAVVTIVWDLVFEITPSVIGFFHNAAAPTTFGLQTCAEITTSLALLYMLYGKWPENIHKRELITSNISGYSFVVLAALGIGYSVLYWNVHVPSDLRAGMGVTYYEFVLSGAGVVGNFIGIIIERSMMKNQYSATVHAHHHQLWLCLLASTMVGFAAMAPLLGWKESWLSPEFIGGLVISTVAMVEGLHIFKQRDFHRGLI